MQTVIAAGSYEGTTKAEKLTEYIMHHVSPGEKIFGIKSGHDTIFHTNQTLAMLIVSVLLLIIFGAIYKKNQKVPTGITNFLETFVMFVRNEIVIANMGQEDGRKWAPLFCTFFFFVLGCNLLGLIPGSTTATGNINVTAALAGITFFAMTIGAIIAKGPGKWFSAFVPHGVPLPVLFLITPLELLGLVVKTIALMIRLFANMMAGHIVLFAMIGLIYVLGLVALPAAGISFAVYGLEVFVAFLQAYIFTYLSAMFLGSVLHPDH
ncbi:MAG: F0F1 ATP synthase subunit A [Lentisphaeraceae bacterium]|nr:F0F1 ATP synthase subunit A [Lentisphaeraceae bacterium]